MKGGISFDARVQIVITNGFTKKEKEIITTWYDIESTDEDISTERLMAMTADICNVDDGDVASAMCKFQEKYDKLFKGV